MNCRLTVFPEAHFQISIHFLTRFQSRVSVVYITLTGNSKLLPLLSPPRRSDLACLATEERHSPNPVFDPPRGETHRHRGAETRLYSPRQGVSESRFNVPPSQHKFQLKAKKSLLVFPTVVVPLFLPSRQDLSRFFLRPSNSRDGRGNPAFRSGKPHVTAASQRTAEGSATTSDQEMLPSLVSPTYLEGSLPAKTLLLILKLD